MRELAHFIKIERKLGWCVRNVTIEIGNKWLTYAEARRLTYSNKEVILGHE